MACPMTVPEGGMSYESTEGMRVQKVAYPMRVQKVACSIRVQKVAFL